MGIIQSEDYLKWIPEAGDVIHDNLLNDNCNSIAKIIINQNRSSNTQTHFQLNEQLAAVSPEVTMSTSFAEGSKLSSFNQSLSFQFAEYSNILSTNIADTSYDIQRYIRDFPIPFKEPTLEKFSQRVVRDKPVKPLPKYADREPLLSDASYSRPDFFVGGGIIAIIVIGAASILIESYMPKAIIDTLSMIVPLLLIASVAAIFLSNKIDAVARRFNPLSVRAWKSAHAKWSKLKADYARELEEYSKQLSQLESMNEAWNKKEQERIDKINVPKMEAYNSERHRFHAMKANALKYLNAGLQAGDEAVINDFFNLAMLLLKLPYSFPREARLRYLSDRKALLIFFRLPSEENVLSIKAIKCTKKDLALLPVPLKQKESDILYENILAQIALSVIAHLFACDKNNCVETIFFQGWLKYLDKSIGKIAEPTIMTLQASKELTLSIDFLKVDPVECFNRRFKGVCATKTKMIVPVQPIIIFDKNDPRFVSGYDVISTVNAESNLAIMEWQDFENLVRDLFEKKYCDGDQEVKITRSSRDKGVDAVLFDTDPIRGGKIIIQAKRYINTVPVSAIRDLYGTVMSEGANRGIMVTTSQYGSDSYEFAKNKPLTLLSGNELLSLLLGIGINARIDLEEARRLNISSESS